MNGKEIIKNIISGEMPDIEQVRANCLNQTVSEQKKRPAFKPAKILITAAAMMFIIGLFNIQAVIGMINGLFFVPGAGIITESDIIYYGIDKPVEIDTEYGVLTLEIASRITRNGKTDLTLYIDARNIPIENIDDIEPPILADISINGESLGQCELIYKGGVVSRSNERPGFKRESLMYIYSYENFPDAGEFDLTLCGVETNVVLTDQRHNFAISKENNGVTLAAYKFGGAKNNIFVDTIDNHINPDEYIKQLGFHPFTGFEMYDINGDRIYCNGSGAFGNKSEYHYIDISDFNNPDEIKSIKAHAIQLNYHPIRDYTSVIEIPVPKDGDTITTDIKVPLGEYVYKISEVRRDGDVIYYTDNAIPREETHFDIEKRQLGAKYYTPSDFEEELAKAIANRESLIENANLFPENTENNMIPMIGNGVIFGFDENAETIKFILTDITIIQYGDFDIEFD